MIFRKKNGGRKKKGMKMEKGKNRDNKSIRFSRYYYKEILKTIYLEKIAQQMKRIHEKYYKGLLRVGRHTDY